MQQKCAHIPVLKVHNCSPPYIGERPEQQGTYSEARQGGSRGGAGDKQVSTAAAALSVGGSRGECLQPAGPDDQTQECLQEEGRYIIYLTDPQLNDKATYVIQQSPPHMIHIHKGVTA